MYTLFFAYFRISVIAVQELNDTDALQKVVVVCRVSLNVTNVS